MPDKNVEGSEIYPANLIEVSTPFELPEPGMGGFWNIGSAFETVDIQVEAPETPLALLEQLGPSPFQRGRFPLIGFLATTYDKVSRYALEVAENRP